MNNDLMKAILAMDAYNRGGGASITIDQDKIGTATVFKDSDDFISTAGPSAFADFYAISYDYEGQKVICYRGTDDPLGGYILDGDIWNGWFIGGGSTQSRQGELAFKFYQEIVGGVTNAFSANISLTGHSLGGGLAGLIGGVYGKDATMFDNMPFEAALQNTIYATRDTTPVEDFNQDLRTLVYGNGAIAPQNITEATKTISVEGEALELLRTLQATTLLPPLDLGPNVVLETTSESSESVSRHSQSMLIIRMFADTDEVSEIAWLSAAQYFWPVLYDSGFSGLIGMDNILGLNNTDGQYDAILRAIIAYSAIPQEFDAQGNETSVTIFGDTGIRALYDDANNLGKAITDAGASSVIETYGMEISKAFVQFAGQLALSKINQGDDLTWDETTGVLTYDPVGGDTTLTIDFTDDLWSAAGKGTLPNMAARAALIGDIWTGTGLDTQIRAAALDLWGDDTTNVIDQVIFAIAGAGTYTLPYGQSAPDQASLFMGSVGDDSLIGEVGNHLVISNGGNDQLDYSSYNYALTFNFEGDERARITGGAGTNEALKDYVVGIDQYVLTGAADTVKFSTNAQFDSSIIIDAGEGRNHLDFTDYNEGVNISVDSGVGYANSGSSGNAFNIQSFTKFTGSDYADTFVDGAGEQDYDGGAGVDTLDFSASTSPVIVNTFEDVYNGVFTLEIGDAGWTFDRSGGFEQFVGTGGDDYFFANGEGAVGVNYSYSGGGNSSYLNPQDTLFFGRDTVDFTKYTLDAFGTGIDVTLTGSGNGSGTDSLGGSFSLSGIEHIIGTDGVDTLIGDSGSNWLQGGAGDDFLQGNGGNDHLISEVSSSDFLVGGTGDDTYYLYGDSGDIMSVSITDSSGTNDKIFILQNNYDTAIDYSLLQDIEYLESSDGSVFKIAGLGLTFTQNLSDPADEIIGGTAGADVLNGNAGNDYIQGGTGADIINGGTGDDALYANAQSISTLDTDVDKLYGGEGNDFLYGSGGGDTLSGDEGYDYIFGKNGDILLGGAGQDQLEVTGDGATLNGGDGNDNITVIGNNNIIEASAGIDVVTVVSGTNNKLLITGESLSSLNFEISSNGSHIIERSNGDRIILPNSIDYLNFGGLDIAFSDALNQENFTYRSSVVQDTTIEQDVGKSYSYLPQVYHGFGEDNVYYSYADGDEVYSGGGNNFYIFDTVYDPGNTTTIAGDIDSKVDIIHLDGINSLDDVQLVFDFGSLEPTVYLYYGHSKIFILNAMETGASDHYQVALDSVLTPGEVDLYSLWEINHVVKHGNNGDQPGYSVDDVIYAFGGNAIFGYTGNDIIYGTIFGDELYGGTGDDTLYGDEGDDLLYGEDNNDDISGGEGNDQLFGGAGDDILDGNFGNDEIDGGDGVDILTDSAGHDIYHARSNDTLIVGHGDNTVIAEEADLSVFTIDLSAYDNAGQYQFSRDFSINSSTDYKLVYGNNSLTLQDYHLLTASPSVLLSSGQSLLSNLVITGNGSDLDDFYSEDSFMIYQNDLVHAKDGNDNFTFMDGNDVFYGGEGNDTVSKVFGFSFTLPDGTVIGTPSATGNLTAYGEGGDDFLQGGIGNDTLDGGIGNDLIYDLWGGADTLNGGDGDDLFALDATGGDTIDGGDGNDTIVFAAANTLASINSSPFSSFVVDLTLGTATASQGGVHQFSNIENVIGSEENDVIIGDSNDNEIAGYQGDDDLQGGLGNDRYIFGDNEADPLTYNDGIDIIFDAGGDDDSVVFAQSALTADFDITSLGNDLIIDYTNGQVIITDFSISDHRIENIEFSDGTVLNLENWATFDFGTENADIITSTTTETTVYSGAGDDQLFADQLGAVLYAGLGADILNGNIGNDFLSGGFGNDILLGGLGDDIYAFAAGDGFDVITDISGYDILSIGKNIAFSDLVFSRDGNNLKIDIASGVTITDFYSGNPDNWLEEIQFFDGSSFDLTSLLDPTAQSDSFTADQDSAITGNVLLDNGNGADSDPDGGILSVVAGTFATANGSITIAANGDFTYTPNTGYSGVDTFAYTLEDGQGGSDTGLAIFKLISPDDVFFGTSVVETFDGGVGNDMVSYAGSDALVSVDLDGSNTGGYADGDTLVSIENVIGSFYADTLSGDSFDNTLNGYLGDDILQGRLGNDNLFGGDGNDTYVFGAGDGNDIITETSGFDVLSITGGITLGDLTFTQIGSDLQIDIDASNGFVITGFYSGISSRLIEEIHFSDGSTFDLTSLVAPIAQDDVFTADQDTNVTGNVLVDNGNGADSDPDGGILSVVAGTFATTNGSVTIAANGDFTYTPNAGYSGVDTFDYTLDDGQGFTDVGTVSITLNYVAPPNTPPVAVDDAFTGNEDAVITGNVLVDNGSGADSDVDLDILSVTAGTFATTNGSVTILANGDFTYTPNANYNGSDSFSYTVLDGNGGSDTGLVSLNIAPVNDAPVAVDDSAVTNEDTAVTITVLSNDSDIDGDILSVTAVTGALNGSAAINPDNTITYTPNANYNGSETLTYTVIDGNGGSDTATINITVNAVNDAPIAVDDIASGDQDTVILGNVLLNDSDIDGGVLSVVAATINTVNGGAVDLLTDGSFVYTPASGYYGADSFDYTVQDGQGGSDVGTVNITVNQVVVTNTPPVAVDDAFTGNEDAVITGNVLVDNGSGADSDVDLDTLSVTAGTFATTNGSVTIAANGAFTYTPNANYNGADSFAYTLLDGQGGSDIGNVNLTINAVNDNPVATDDSAVTNEDTAVTISVLSNDSDIDGDILSVSAVTGPLNGSAVINLDNTITYTPNANYNGSETLTYTVIDGNGGSDTATINITVNAVNDAPVAADDAFTGNEDAVITGNVLVDNGSGADSDADLDTLSVTAGTFATTNGSVTILANGAFTYTPNANYNGADSFSYTVLDGNGGSDTGLVNLTINAVNDAPVAADDAFTGNQDTTIIGNLLVNNGNGVDSDVDGDPLSVVAGTFATTNGSVTIAANGDFTYTPNAGYTGADSFGYTLQDGQGGSDTGLASLTINAAPSSDIYGTSGNDTITGTAGDDVIHGLAGYDFISGELGNDTLYGNEDGDTLKGRDGDDILYGGDGIDYLEGNGGNDFLYGGMGIDSLKGSAGIDTFVYLSSLEGGDVIFDFNPNAGEKIDLTAVLVNAVGFQDTQAFIDGYLRTQQNGLDVELYLDMDGTAGGGAEILYITMQNLSVGDIGLSAFILPVSGAPINYAPIAADDVFSGKQDLDISGNVLLDNGNGVDSDANGDILSVTAQTIATTNGSVTIIANGDFTYTPNAGYVGADSFNYTVLDGQGGSDIGLVSLTLTPTNEILGTASGETITGTAADDAIYGLGGDDFLSGELGNDVIYGGDGNDTLKGRDGDDILYGGAGDDYLEGNGGNDFLYGGEGIDTLKGGVNIDTFVFETMTGIGDTIIDFRPNDGDAIDISDLLSAYDPLTELITDFVQITDNGIDSYLAVDIDGGANNFVQIATIVNYIGLTDEEALEVSGNLITA